MRCDACGVELIPGKAFCHACGARTPAQCRKCGAPLDPAFRFCPDCGTPTSPDVLVPPPPPAPRPVDPLTRLLAQRGGTVVANPSQIEGERKQVTVLFCDLVGSTSIAERLDPEEYHDLLEDYLEAVFPEIYRREGVVNQLAGDGLMALFGAPVAHEDAPWRAVRAALGMREALGPLAERLRAKHGIDLTLRIGINTGPVVVGPVGNDRKMDYSAIGDTTNMASRLQSLAPVGGILISEATYRLVRGFFDVEQVGPLEVRGKTEPVTAYLVTDWRGDVTRLGVAEERGLTPFVGREAELDRLVDAFRRLGDGQAQVVAVVGDAGIGKSRLLYELKARLADDSVVFFEGSGTSMLQALPYHLFVMMLGRYFGLEWDEDVEASCDRVAKKFGASYEDIEREYPVLCRFLSLPLESLADQPADELRRQTFDAVARLVLRESESHPVVMLVEDLHWADEPSRELLQDLVRRLAGSPVLIVLTHRPDAVPHWTAPVAFSQIALRPLSDESTRAVVRAVAGPLPRDVERVLVQKAGGSPFFAEELVRGLIEEGHLSPSPGGGHRLTRPLADVPIPGTIQEVIAARLDALSPPAKRVVQVAAVLGRQFSRKQLTQLLADEGIDVERELHDLERRGLVHRKAVLSNDDLRFGESLTQEVAYEGLLLKQRRLLHERIGELLEHDLERNPEHAALLAHHYSRSDNHTKAIDALLRAAREAEEAPSYRVAADLYRRAWRLAETVLGEREDGRFHRAALTAVSGITRLTVFFGAVDLSEAEEAAVRGRELAALLGDQGTLAQLHYAHGIITIMRPNAPDFAGGLALAERGLTIAEEAGLDGERSRIARGLAMNYAVDGRFDQARSLIERRAGRTRIRSRWRALFRSLPQHPVDPRPGPLRVRRSRLDRHQGQGDVRDVRRAGQSDHPHRDRHPARAGALPPCRVRRGTPVGGHDARDRGGDRQRQRVHDLQLARPVDPRAPRRAGRRGALRRSHRAGSPRRRADAAQHALRGRGAARDRRPRAGRSAHGEAGPHPGRPAPPGPGADRARRRPRTPRAARPRRRALRRGAGDRRDDRLTLDAGRRTPRARRGRRRAWRGAARPRAPRRDRRRAPAPPLPSAPRASAHPDRDGRAVARLAAPSCPSTSRTGRR